MDDWSALELEGDDEDLENLFGNVRLPAQQSKTNTALHARPSSQTSQCSILQPRNNAFHGHATSAAAVPASTAGLPVPAQANNRKRSAASLDPGNSRTAEHRVFDGLSDAAYDELELESLSAVTPALAYSQHAQAHASQSIAVRTDLPQASAHARRTNQANQSRRWPHLPEPLQHATQQGVAARMPAAGPAANSDVVNATDPRWSKHDQINVSILS